MTTKVNPPLTGSGVALVVTLSPTPSCPPAFSPQQYATPSDVSAHVWEPPTLNDANAIPPATSSGLVLDFTAELPSCPLLFDPQQYALPAADNPHVCCVPASRLTRE